LSETHFTYVGGIASKGHNTPLHIKALLVLSRGTSYKNSWWGGPKVTMLVSAQETLLLDSPETLQQMQQEVVHGPPLCAE